MNLRDHWLYSLVLRLWPEIVDKDERQQTQVVLGMIPLIYLGPFAFLGLGWLILVTDISQLFGSGFSYLLLLGTMLLLLNQPFNIYIGLGGRANIALTSSLAPLVLWSTVLITGPNGLWVVVVAEAITNLRLGWQFRRYQSNPFSDPISRFVQELSNSVFATLLALQVYQFLGGSYPLSSSEPAGWVPALVAITLGALLPGLLMLPMIFTINRMTNTPNNLGRLAQLEAGIVGISLLMSPFSILVAILYADGLEATLVFVLAGVILVNWLAHHLSQARERSEQQAREFAILEELGETLLQGSPDTAHLPETLKPFVDRMFPLDRVEVRLFEPEHGQKWTAFQLLKTTAQDPVSDEIWQQMCDSKDPFISFSQFILPGAKAVYGDGLAAKIISLNHRSQGEGALCIGGVYLLRQATFGKSVYSLAAVQSLATQVASAVYRAEVHAETMAYQKMEQELEFAGRVQHSFLPSQVPQIEGWQLSAILEPARQTSGDFYDFVPLSENKLGILVADVSDKGTGAALYMALSRTLIRTYALQYHDNPSIVLSLVNDRLFSDTQSDQFVTVFYGILITRTGGFIYSNAGHNPAFVLRASNGNKPESLAKTGIPLGMFEGMAWEKEEIQLLPGDLLLMYSDGLTEAQDTDNNLYDVFRLLATGQANLGRSAKEIEDAIIQSINEFVGDAPQFDDITLLIATRK